MTTVATAMPLPDAPRPPQQPAPDNWLRTPCMGGWCAGARDTCGRYHTPLAWVATPAERLCPPGSTELWMPIAGVRHPMNMRRQ